MSQRGEQLLRIWMGGTITLLWATSLIVDMVVVDYDPPAGVGSVMLAVATALFGQPVVKEIRRRANGTRNGD